MEKIDAKGLIKGLENWAKRVTAGYRDVNVTNMSSSFRDGLAFCAIIHHYRPDLIKEDIFDNNSLAFSTAEKQLGVPALLEAKDMEQYSQPDRLSIITYLSQLHNCFENQNKVKTMKSSFKRRQSNSSGPPPKVLSVQPKLLSSNRNDTCYSCNHRVFILERLIVDSKLYHTTCFRCSKCNCLLNPGTYVEGDTPGRYECAVCMPDESTDSMETQDTTSLDSYDSKTDSLSDAPVKPVSPLPSRVAAKSLLTDKVTSARSTFLQHSLTPKSPEVVPSPALRRSASPSESSKSLRMDDSAKNGFSVKSRISVFESSKTSKSESFLNKSEIDASSKPKLPSDSGAINGEVPALKKSLRNSAISMTAIKSDSKPTESLISPDKTSKNSPSLDFTNTVSSNSTSNLSTPSSDIESPQTDKSNCDTLASPSTFNKVPSPAARRSLLLKSPSTEDGTKKSQFNMGEYKSPLRNSRDIFQTNLQPLKLSIPSINSSLKNEAANSPSASTPDSVKSPVLEIPQIRSTYARTLPRPGSASVTLTPKDKESGANTNSESSLTDVLHSKWSRTTPRRSSFDSPQKDSESIDSPSMKKENSMTFIENFAKKGNTDRDNSFFQRHQTSTPIPSPRRSLESKNYGLGKPPSPPSEVDSPMPTSNQNLPSKDIINKKKVEIKIDNPSPISSQKLHTKDLSNKKAEVSKTTEPDIVYPDDLNPFGDDDDEEQQPEDEYPDDLNPFGDDDEDIPEPKSSSAVADYDETMNPFASDDDDDESNATPIKQSSKPPRPAPPQTALRFQQDSSFSSISTPTGTPKGTLKKRPAPRPPGIKDIFPNEDSEADVSLKSGPSPSLSRKGLQTPSPKFNSLRKSKPAPPPPPTPPVQSDAKAKSVADETPKQPKAKKKRPAPPVPIPKRKDNKKIPLKEILREMKEIEEKQRECERQGREIELLIRDKDKDEEASVEEEEYIMQLFELVNQKNALFRRQAELMYIKRSQRLEEQQSDIETKIRQLMMKPEEDKTNDDRSKEEELILELKDIVDQRSSIIDSIEMDRRRELEEDASIQEQVEIKNGDLPITAEIKEKSTEKKKKFKLKKDKKKKDSEKKSQENEEGEKKKKEKKKWLSTKKT
ncbi:hypothetical protein JTE90_016208 [Oedothorax gibbosus]|uniref:MICAL-like protein 1 n=1 Tax=Oedothorax gibbosus TaxID=931172 RepID=A0AAV6UKD4_9ARAC|nr:hypothetical protein JTE90_016208 [Oedothorax gibbosus]